MTLSQLSESLRNDHSKMLENRPHNRPFSIPSTSETWAFAEVHRVEQSAGNEAPANREDAEIPRRHRRQVAHSGSAASGQGLNSHAKNDSLHCTSTACRPCRSTRSADGRKDRMDNRSNAAKPQNSGAQRCFTSTIVGTCTY